MQPDTSRAFSPGPKNLACHCADGPESKIFTDFYVCRISLKPVKHCGPNSSDALASFCMQHQQAVLANIWDSTRVLPTVTNVNRIPRHTNTKHALINGCFECAAQWHVRIDIAALSNVSNPETAPVNCPWDHTNGMMVIQSAQQRHLMSTPNSRVWKQSPRPNNSSIPVISPT